MKTRAAFLLTLCVPVVLASGCDAPSGPVLVPPALVTLPDTRPGVTISQANEGSLNRPGFSGGSIT